MVACLLSCHVSIVDMNRLSPVTGLLPCLCSYKLSRDAHLVGFRFGVDLQRKERLKRKPKLVVSADLSRAFSLSLGLDSQVIFSLFTPFLSLILCLCEESL